MPRASTAAYAKDLDAWFVTANGRTYRVAFRPAPVITGWREWIIPSTAISAHPDRRTSAVFVDPHGRLGRRLLAAIKATR